MESEIKNTIESILDSAQIPYTEVSLETDDSLDMTFFSIDTQETPILIGKRGETLRAINYLIKKIFENKYPEKKADYKYMVDVGGHNRKRIDEIKTKARILAERAKSFQRSVECDPMHPYDRLILHSALASDPNIQTESIGFGKDRRVVVKYVESTNEII